MPRKIRGDFMHALQKRTGAEGDERKKKRRGAL